MTRPGDEVRGTSNNRDWRGPHRCRVLGLLRVGLLFVWGCASAAVLCLSSSVQAAPVKVRLVYERLGAADVCPGAEVLTVAIRERLGYSPADFSAQEVIRVTIEPKGRRGLKAAIVWLDSSGLALGQRRLSGRRKQCDLLIADIALAVAVALDPTAVEALKQGKVKVQRPRRSLLLAGPRQPRRQNLAKWPSKRSIPGPLVHPQPSEPTPSGWFVSVVVGTMLGRDAVASPRGAVDVGYFEGLWSGALRLAASGIWPQDVGDGVSYSLVTPSLSIRGCVRPAPVEVCLRLAGTLSIARGEGRTREATSIIAGGSAGVHVGAWLPVAGPVRPYFEVTAEVPFAPVGVVIADVRVFRSWPVVVGIGAGLRLSL